MHMLNNTEYINLTMYYVNNFLFMIHIKPKVYKCLFHIKHVGVLSF